MKRKSSNNTIKRDKWERTRFNRMTDLFLFSVMIFFFTSFLLVSPGLYDCLVWQECHTSHMQPQQPPWRPNTLEFMVSWQVDYQTDTKQTHCLFKVLKPFLLVVFVSLIVFPVSPTHDPNPSSGHFKMITISLFSVLLGYTPDTQP